MKLKYFLAIALTATLVAAACQDSALLETDEGPAASEASHYGARNGSLGSIVVANRGAGSITVIDATDDTIEGTYPLPDDGEPMYVVWSQTTNRVFVGDRANSSVVVFDGNDYSVIGSVPAGEGVFHMWADVRGRHQLWVNNDVDKTTTVIHPVTLGVLATIPMPADLEALGGKPHDVLVSPEGDYAYVSILGIDGEYDYVVQYSTSTFLETGRAAVGQDPHLSATFVNNYLYVPTQNSDAIYVLNRQTMAEVDVIDAPGAHGAGMPFNGERFYTTNLPGSGTDGLLGIDPSTGTVVDVVDTPLPVPHNIALAPNLAAGQNANKLYLTHSGATATGVSVYDVTGASPVYLKTIHTGLNPFGIGFAR